MELEFRTRNNDMGSVFPTFQERVNTMLPVDRAGGMRVASGVRTGSLDEGSAAPVLEPKPLGTPHMLNTQEMQDALAQVEQEAIQHGNELIQAHSGLNEQRIARLLGLLE